MKVVLTLTARDEADVIDEHLRYYLEAGVDFVIATDHRSVDGTTEILRRYEQEGSLLLIREDSEAYRQREWVTRMARLAATDYGADWVINSDADEFWWPRNGTLREVLDAAPPRFGAIRGIWRHFVLRPETHESVFERMIVRRKPSLDVTDPYCATTKVIHRGDPEVIVTSGNHDAKGDGLALLREWVPFEIFHFPIRSLEQLERKYRTSRIASYAGGDFEFVPKHIALLGGRLLESLDEAYDEFLVDDAELERALAAGRLSIDTRLRDTLRGERSSSGQSLADEISFAEEVDSALSLDAAHRLRARVDSLEQRVTRIEPRYRRRNPSWRPSTFASS